MLRVTVDPIIMSTISTAMLPPRKLSTLTMLMAVMVEAPTPIPMAFSTEIGWSPYNSIP